MWYWVDHARDTAVLVLGTVVDFDLLLYIFPIYPELSTMTMWYFYNQKNVDIIHKKRTNNKEQQFWLAFLLDNIWHYHFWAYLLHSVLAKWDLRSISVFQALGYKLRFHLIYAMLHSAKNNFCLKVSRQPDMRQLALKCSWYANKRSCTYWYISLLFVL